jgi:hypothetical protein
MIRLMLAVLFFAPSAFALTCGEYSSGLAASVYKEGDQIKFKFMAQRGYESIPQFEGPIGGHQMPLVKYQIESLIELGSQFEISMPVSSCDLTRASEVIFACNSGGKIAGTKLSFSSLNGFRVKQSHVSGDFETQNFRLMVGDVDTFFFLMPFPLKSCAGTL